ncbi:hypothetical protein KOXY103107_17045 [Komagataeibacter xylinus]
MRVSARGYRAWTSRPACQRQRTDLKVLAHIREHYALSNGSYGRPRMTMEPGEAGLDVGERHVGRGTLPGLDDRCVFLAPRTFSKGGQGSFSSFSVHSPVDILQNCGHGFAVFSGDEIQRMAQQMNDAGLHKGFGKKPRR